MPQAGDSMSDHLAKPLPQALDVTRLLAGLQRGLVPGADRSVDFLCNKFTDLIERLRRAEAGEQLETQSCKELEERLRTEEHKSDAERRHLEVATIAAREETRKGESSLAEFNEQLAASREQLTALRAEAEALAQRKRMLEDLCRNERAKASEAHARLRRQQLLRPQAADDVRRLQGHVQSLNGRKEAVEAEIDGVRGRAGKDEEIIANMKSEVIAEEEAHEVVLERAAVLREDVDQARSHLATLQEQLAERQVILQRYASECHRSSERRLAMQADTDRRRSWLDVAQKELEALQDTERGLERVHAETVQLHAQLRVEEEEVKHAEAWTVSKKAELCDTDDKLVKQIERMQQVEQHRDKVRAEAASAEDEEARASASVEQLRHDQAAGGGMRRNLESELSMLNAEAEKLRGELTFLGQEKLESQQRFQLISPALQEARRHVKDLESQVEAARDEAAHEKELAQRLERETDVCQDKLRALRDENVRLSEQCTELEAQLALSTREPLPAASFARRSGGFPASTSDKALRAKSMPRRRDSTPSRRPTFGTPRTGGERPPGARASRSETCHKDRGIGTPVDKEPDGVSKLQLITEFIRNEEGRLSSSGLPDTVLP